MQVAFKLNLSVGELPSRGYLANCPPVANRILTKNAINAII